MRKRQKNFMRKKKNADVAKKVASEEFEASQTALCGFQAMQIDKLCKVL